MIFSNDISTQVAIFVLGLCGFWVAKHIYNHKKTERPLVCPVGFDCNFVVHSDYAEFMHIPLEIFGMIYYALIAFSYFLFIFMENTIPVVIFSFIVAVSLSAFIFSLYLVIVQIFILKKGCSWCIVSAVISALIFILTVVK